MIMDTFSTAKNFNRIWTLQEAVTAGLVSIRCGGEQVGVTAIAQALIYLNKPHPQHETLLDELVTLFKINYAWREGWRLRLQELLFYCRHRDYADPRDKVYALLELIDGRTDRRLRPNYKMSVQEVYANVMRFMISLEQCLDVICVPRNRPRSKETPSWCPDIRNFGLNDRIVLLIDPSGRMKIFSASKNEIYVLSDAEEAGTRPIIHLATNHLHIGTIRDLSPPSKPNLTLEQAIQDWHDMIRAYGTFAIEEMEALEILVELCSI
jgi:hypothetical protein